MHIHDRDAQIAEHSANIQATVEFHRQRKEQKRCKNHEATQQEFEEHFRACEEHSRNEAAVKVFLQASENANLLSNLQSLGIHNNEAAWNNPNAPTHALKQFLAERGLAKFDEAINFLQSAGIIDDERSIIPTPKNPKREAFSFIFGNDSNSSDSEDSEDLASSESSKSEEAKSSSNLEDSAKEQNSSKKTPRIIRDDEYAILASVINAKKKPEASKENSKEEVSSANEQTEAKQLPPSPPALSFPPKTQFVLSPEQAKVIADENGVKAETIMMVAMMKGVKSVSGASSHDVIMAAMHIEAQKEAEKEKAAKEAAQKFEEETRFEKVRENLLARLAERRSGSVRGCASASAYVVSSDDGDGRFTLESAISNHKEEMVRQCGGAGLLAHLKAASKNEAPPSAEQSAEPQSAEQNQ